MWFIFYEIRFYQSFNLTTDDHFETNFMTFLIKIKPNTYRRAKSKVDRTFKTYLHNANIILMCEKCIRHFFVFPVDV